MGVFGSHLDVAKPALGQISHVLFLVLGLGHGQDGPAVRRCLGQP